MKNTKLLIGLAIGGGLAYFYSKSKKSLSKTSQSETSQFENKSKADSAIYGGKGFGEANSVPTDKPVFKGYDPVYNKLNEAKIFNEFEIFKTKLNNPFGGAPKVLPSSTDYVMTPDNTQGVVRVVNNMAIDKMPNIVNQEDIELFFFNNPNISSIEDNTIRDAKGYPIYQKIRKSDVQKDALGAVVYGYSNGYNFYKENNKFYIKEATNAGINPLASAYIICEISQSDWLDFFINVKDGSYRKINSPSIKKLNCSTYRNGIKSIW
jgi:hypothetical protein